MESYYDIPALTTDQRFIDSIQLIRQYSLLPFMNSRKFFYPRVVLEFYHTMTLRGVPSSLKIRFSIDSRPRLLRAIDIKAALGLPVVLANSTDYRRWPQPSQREMVRSLARDTTVGAYTIPLAALPTDAPGGPRTPEQLIPTSSLCTA